MSDSGVRERRANKTEKSDSEQVLEMLDGEPEVSCVCFLYSSACVDCDIKDTKESTLNFEMITYSVFISLICSINVQTFDFVENYSLDLLKTRLNLLFVAKTASL